MKINLDSLLVLEAIERYGSFAQAARHMHRVPSAISYTIRKLEDDLGFTVFDRSQTRPKLTEAGRVLLADGRNLLDGARRLEARSKRIATGWETELRIAVDQILPPAGLLPICQTFYAMKHNNTYLRFSHETLGGAWDALYTDRADLVIGASGEQPSKGSYTSLPLGEIRMLFTVAPDHPLALIEQPITPEELLKHRVVAVADSSRELKPKSHNILSGQETLTVPNMQFKLQAQVAGLGVGRLPDYLAMPAIQSGQLLMKAIANPMPNPVLHLAWKTENKGKALLWFIQEIIKPGTLAELHRSTADA